MENPQNNSHIHIIIKNLWTQSKYKKKNYNKSIINPSKTNHKNPIIFTQFLPLILRALCPSQITPPHSHRDNSYATNRSIHTPISVTSNFDRLVSLTQPMKKIYFFEELLLFNTTCGNFYFYFLNDRILLIFNILLTLGHTWHACINVIHL